MSYWQWLVVVIAIPIAALILSTSLAAFGGGLYAVRRGVPMQIVAPWFAKGMAVYLVGLPVDFLGLLMVPLAYPFRIEHDETRKPFTQYPQWGSWVLCNLPAWARWWDNPRDGMYGDKRGWFANECGGEFDSLWSVFKWAALRNPSNYFSRVTTAIDTTDGTLKFLAGNSEQASENGFGWHFISCEKDGKILGCLLQAAIVYPFSKKYGFYCRFGYKIELDEPMTANDDIYDRMRSSCWKCSFWKDLS